MIHSSIYTKPEGWVQLISFALYPIHNFQISLMNTYFILLQMLYIYIGYIMGEFVYDLYP